MKRNAATTASVSLKVITTGALLLAMVACSRPTPNSLQGEWVGALPAGVNADSYRDRKMNPIELEPGNHNAAISWATLFDSFPGEMGKPEEKPPTIGNPATPAKTPEQEADEDLARKLVGGKSTKKTFQKWANDPVGLQTELKQRFMRTMRSLIKDKNVKGQVLTAAKAHGVDPVLVIACIVGEHTFNVGALDTVQNYAVKAAIWADLWTVRFKSNKIDLVEFLKRSEFDSCTQPWRAGGTSADYWNCVTDVWGAKFQGKNPDKDKGGTRFPSTTFKYTFFNPLSTGYSYGLGQMDPIRALMVADTVHAKSALRLLTVDSPADIYTDIIDQNTTVHYIAANVRLMIDTYKAVAGFDISKNPGVVATLYNIGKEKSHALDLYKANLKSLPRGTLITPIENYYGFYVNEHEALIRQAFDKWAI